MDNVGYFLFSLDLELATGRFDRDSIRHKMFSIDGSRERESIFRLIDLFEQFNIVGTWATVGHLFYDKCEHCDPCPIWDRKGKYSSFEEAYGTDNPLWYGSDIIDELIIRGPRQEIAFHGFSHKVFNENQMSSQDARLEIQEWLQVSKKRNILPEAVVFPRNAIGYLDILREEGIICYRSEPKRPQLFRTKYLGKFIKNIDSIFGLLSLPIYDVNYHTDQNIVNLPASNCFFDLNRKLELILDRMNLHNFRLRRVIQGIKSAANSNKMIHIWAHPCDFRTEKDFIKLRHIFACVSQEVNMGRMRSVGMTEMARIIINKHNIDSA